MSYSIGLYFEESTENMVRSIWKLMADRGVSDYLHLSANRPHFTISIFTDLDIPNASKRLAEIASENKPFTVVFSYIGCFPSLKPDLFLGPVVIPELLDIHHLVDRQFTGLGNYPDFDYYRPGHWVPHCAIAMGIDFKNIQAAIDVTHNLLEFPFTAQVVEIGLIEFRPVKHLFSFRIGR